MSYTSSLESLFTDKGKIRLRDIKAKISDLAEEMESHAARINRHEEYSPEDAKNVLSFTRRHTKLIEALQVLNHICFENIDNE
jgi:hypothetical protein